MRIMPAQARDVFSGIAGPRARISVASNAPSGRITVRLNMGLPKTTSPEPGSTGYMPKADQTNQALICPQSSLPHSPSGALAYMSRQMVVTRSAVAPGSPAYEARYATW